MTNHECRFCFTEYPYKCGHMICQNGHFTCESCYTTWKLGQGQSSICPWCFEPELKSEKVWKGKLLLANSTLELVKEQNKQYIHKLYYLQYINHNLTEMMDYLRNGEQYIYLPIVLKLSSPEVIEILNKHYGRPEYPIVKYIITKPIHNRVTMTVTLLNKTRRLITLLSMIEKEPVKLYYDDKNYIKIVKYHDKYQPISKYN